MRLHSIDSQPNRDPELIKRRGRAIASLAENEGWKTYLEPWLTNEMHKRDAILRTCGIEVVTPTRAAIFALEAIFKQLHEWVNEGKRIEQHEALLEKEQLTRESPPSYEEEEEYERTR